MVLCSPIPPIPPPLKIGGIGGGEDNEIIKLAMELYKSVKMLMVYHLRIVKNYCSAPLFSYGEVAILANDH